MTTCERFHNSGIDEPHECVFEGVKVDIPALEAHELPPPGRTRSLDPLPIPTGYRYRLMMDYLEEAVGPGIDLLGRKEIPYLELYHLAQAKERRAEAARRKAEAELEQLDLDQSQD